MAVPDAIAGWNPKLVPGVLVVADDTTFSSMSDYLTTSETPTTATSPSTSPSTAAWKSAAGTAAGEPLAHPNASQYPWYVPPLRTPETPGTFDSEP
jgi:hypothetical protein